MSPYPSGSLRLCLSMSLSVRLYVDRSFCRLVSLPRCLSVICSTRSHHRSVLLSLGRSTSPSFLAMSRCRSVALTIYHHVAVSSGSSVWWSRGHSVVRDCNTLPGSLHIVRCLVLFHCITVEGWGGETASSPNREIVSDRVVRARRTFVMSEPSEHRGPARFLFSFPSARVVFSLAREKREEERKMDPSESNRNE